MITRNSLGGLFSLLTLLLGFAVMTMSAVAQEPSPALGQIVAWKAFPTAPTYYQLPTSKVDRATNSGSWFQTTMPSSPNFTKLYNDTGLWCFVMLDVVPTTTGTISMAIRVDDGSKWQVQQALSSQPRTWLTYSFGFVWSGIPAGNHQVTIQMQSFDGSSAWFSAHEANLQCFEMVLPPSEK